MSFIISKWKQNLLTKKSSVVYTMLIMIMHLAFGLNMNIFGASLVDLGFIYGVPIETMSNVAVTMGFGYLVGALVGWCYKWFNRQLVLTFLLSIMALTLALVPHYGFLWIALTALVINGIGCGAWDAASGYWVVEMWPTGNAPLLQFLHFIYGCGTVVAPLLVAPYLYGETVVVNNRTITVEDRIQLLSRPYTIAGFMVGIVPVIMIILFFINRYQKPTENNPNKEISKNGNIQDSESKQIPYRKIKLAMCGLCLSGYATAELGWFGFGSALFQSLPIKMNASDGAYMMSLFSATFTLGRLITAFITVKLVPDWILAYHYVIAFGAIVLTFLGRNDQTLIYVGSAILGYGFSAMWPAILAFTQRHLRLSDRICSLYSFMTGLMSLVIPLILGQTFDKHPLMLFLLEAFFIVFSCVMFVGVRVWIERDNRKRT